MCFLFYCPKSKNLLCIVIVHVDDFLFAYSPLFDIAILENLFTWGSMTMAPETITFLNREVRRIGKDKILISQTAYTSNITVRALKRGIDRSANLDARGITE